MKKQLRWLREMGANHHIEISIKIENFKITNMERKILEEVLDQKMKIMEINSLQEKDSKKFD